jgi:hypothetical protein
VDLAVSLGHQFAPIVLHESKAVPGYQRQSESSNQLRKERLDIEQIHVQKLILPQKLFLPQKSFLIAVLAAGLVLSGCRVESRTIVSWDDTGGGSIDAQVLLDDEAAAFVGRQGDTPRDVAGNLAVSLGSSAAGYNGISRQLEVGSLTGVGVLFEDLGAGDISAIVTDSGSVIQDLSISLRDETLSIEVIALPDPDVDTRRLLETTPRNVRELASLILELNVPGTIVTHNADRRESNRLEWELIGSILDEQPVTARVEALVPPGFVFAADRGPDPTAAGTQPTTEEEQGASAIVWILPLVAGGVTWLLLARRSQ